MQLSVNKLSELTGVDRRTIKKRLIEAGVIQTDEGYPAHLAFRAIFSPKAPDIADSEAKISAANARTAEVKANKAEEKVIETAIVDMAWSEMTILIAQKLDLLVPKFKSRYAVGMNEQDASAIIEQELHDIRTDLSKPVTYSQSSDAEEATDEGDGESGSEAQATD
jgi:phage terminase Nu1 subunit (DNA packaging protein)